MDAFLREVADLRAFRGTDLSAGSGDDPGDALHERGFSGPVVTREGDALTGLDGEGEVAEEDARAELDAKCLDGNHGRREVA